MKRSLFAVALALCIVAPVALADISPWIPRPLSQPRPALADNTHVPRPLKRPGVLLAEPAPIPCCRRPLIALA